MEKLYNSEQLEIGEQYRFIITYTGPGSLSDDDWLSCDIVTQITDLNKNGMIHINTILTNSNYYWPIGKDEFMLVGMVLDHDIEFQKL